MAAVNKKDLAEVGIPVVDIEVQRNIVEQLDAISELAILVRAERDARRKQFEHYRDRLLAFPEKVA